MGRSTSNGRTGHYDSVNDVVQTVDYEGPCRRTSSEAERDAWRKEHHGDDQPWHAHLPKSFIVTMLLATLGVLGWFEVRWRDSVEDRLGGVGSQILEMRKDWLEDARRAAQRDGDREYVRRLDDRLRALEAQTKAQP